MNGTRCERLATEVVAMSDTKQESYPVTNEWSVFCSCWYGRMLITSARVLLILVVAFLVAGFN